MQGTTGHRGHHLASLAGGGQLTGPVVCSLGGDSCRGTCLRSCAGRPAHLSVNRNACSMPGAAAMVSSSRLVGRRWSTSVHGGIDSHSVRLRSTLKCVRPRALFVAHSGPLPGTQMHCSSSRVARDVCSLFCARGTHDHHRGSESAPNDVSGQKEVQATLNERHACFAADVSRDGAECQCTENEDHVGSARDMLRHIHPMASHPKRMQRLSTSKRAELAVLQDFPSMV